MITQSIGFPTVNKTKSPIAQFTKYKHFSMPGTYSSEVVPADVTQMFFLVIGAGGSGGAISAQQATGGGGGGFACGVWDCVPGQAIPTITVGAGGTGVVGTNNGNAGGTSSIGTLISATGGGAGLQQNAASAALAGGAGGVGSVAGNLRQAIYKNGGRGGNKDATFTGTTNYTGGGGCGLIIGNGGRGGDIQATANTIGTGGGGVNGGNGGDITGAAANSWTGGGGVGYRGGNVTGTSTGTKATGGGGVAGNGTDSTVTGTTTEFTVSGSSITPGLTVQLINWISILLDPLSFAFSGGGPGASGANTSATYNFSGGGGQYNGRVNCLLGSSGASSLDSGTANYGGSGGACGGNSGYVSFGGGSGASNNTSGSGGNGLVIIAWTQGY